MCDDYVRTLARLDPVAATAMGVPGHEARLPDLSPAGRAERADAARAALHRAASVDLRDDADRVTRAALEERLGVELELDDAGELLGRIDVIASPLQDVRDVFDLMATGTEEDWSLVAARLRAVPAALAGWTESLRAAAATGRVAARRQVAAAAAQADDVADPAGSPFTALTRAAREPGRQAPPGTLVADLDRAAGEARHAYADLARTLRSELAPLAPERDGVGRERYALWSRAFLGARVDLDETYAWGLAELDRLDRLTAQAAAAVAGPGATPEEAAAVLDRDPARVLRGPAALQAWLQATADAAIEALAGTHVDIPPPLRRLECRIAPTHTGGIYYTAPSADFSRPGRMWWSLPEGLDGLTTWRERTTVHHEGVPGHHLQIGLAQYRAGELNDWRRLACWVSGHGEGWALYAEQLMAELGFMDDPGDRLGLLDGMRLRAARVVLDVGVHLGLPCPARWGGGTWDATRAWRLLRASAMLPEPILRFELDRYLGWPGQAASYAVGHRVWAAARDDAARADRALGRSFDLRAFHRRALDLGSLPLEVLRSELARQAAVR